MVWGQPDSKHMFLEALLGVAALRAHERQARTNDECGQEQEGKSITLTICLLIPAASAFFSFISWIALGPSCPVYGDASLARRLQTLLP